ncbi:MAG: hypothetical protein PHI40_01575, partial [Caldisericia bacterium]|nr:hypothetical protein [Caldisericia bacterium]
CILKCPAAYKVVPKNEKCTFSPESQEVKVPCCPEVAKVTFRCKCKKENVTWSHLLTLLLSLFIH